jgi:hypothetical protein
VNLLVRSDTDDGKSTIAREGAAARGEVNQREIGQATAPRAPGVSGTSGFEGSESGRATNRSGN